MSLEKLDHMFSALSTCEAWSIQLLKINTSKRAATTYMGREITFAPNGQLRDFVSDIVSTKKKKKGILHAFTDVREYDGSALNQVIYKLPITSELIAEEYKAFLEGIILELLRYKFYICTLKNDDGLEIEHAIISRRDLTGNVNEEIYLKSLNDEYKLDVQ